MAPTLVIMHQLPPCIPQHLPISPTSANSGGRWSTFHHVSAMYSTAFTQGFHNFRKLSSGTPHMSAKQLDLTEILSSRFDQNCQRTFTCLCACPHKLSISGVFGSDHYLCGCEPVFKLDGKASPYPIFHHFLRLCFNFPSTTGQVYSRCTVSLLWPGHSIGGHSIQ